MDFLSYKKALRAGAHCGGGEYCCQKQPAAGGESCKQGSFLFHRKFLLSEESKIKIARKKRAQQTDDA